MSVFDYFRPTPPTPEEPFENFSETERSVMMSDGTWKVAEPGTIVLWNASHWKVPVVIRAMRRRHTTEGIYIEFGVSDRDSKKIIGWLKAINFTKERTA